MMRNTILVTLVLLSFTSAQTFSIARVQYGGGGDWYSDPSSLPNLLRFISQKTPLSVDFEETRIKLTDDHASHFPYLYLTGHGNVKFSENEIIALRSILLNGGFMHADDNYGMDKSFRREIKRVFPNKDFVPLPNDHIIFTNYFKFPNGLPKVHEHDNKPATAFGLYEGERMILLYTYESDLGDGWEDPSVHGDPWEIREASLKMGVNIVYFVLTQ
tara:strand:+ start:669 stop:1316 length:648 start_codon:yes stop_codon:yes gene_type:complete